MNEVMLYKQTTQVPNFIFEEYLDKLTGAEYKILSWVFRQTFGWVNEKTGRRKMRDYISHSQFQKKTGLSLRVITNCIQSLSVRGLIQITDSMGNVLKTPTERKGKTRLYYAPTHPLHFSTLATAQNEHAPLQKRMDNKTNSTKENETKLSTGFKGIGNIIAQRSNKTALL